MAVSQYFYGSPNPLMAPVATNQAVAVGDIVGLSSGNVVRASDTTWDTNTSTTQLAFAALFLGVAAQKKVSGTARIYGNNEDNRIRVMPSAEVEFDCASANFAVGDLVGPAKDTGNALMDQKVVAVATENLAIGRVTRAGTSVTRVLVKLLSAKSPQARQS